MHEHPKAVTVIGSGSETRVLIRWLPYERWPFMFVMGFAAAAMLYASAYPATTKLAFYRPGTAILGLWLTGMVAVRVFNRTAVFVRDRRLVVEHGPIPWRRGLSIPLEYVAGIKYSPTRRMVILRRNGPDQHFFGDPNAKHMQQAAEVVASTFDLPFERWKYPLQ